MLIVGAGPTGLVLALWLTTWRACQNYRQSRGAWNHVARTGSSRLTSLDWQIHIYGDAAPNIQGLSERQKIPLHIFAWRPAMKQAGLLRNAAYLVRPDGYVALASAAASDTAIDRYLSEKKIRALN